MDKFKSNRQGGEEIYIGLNMAKFWQKLGFDSPSAAMC